MLLGQADNCRKLVWMGQITGGVVGEIDYQQLCPWGQQGGQFVQVQLPAGGRRPQRPLLHPLLTTDVFGYITQRSIGWR